MRDRTKIFWQRFGEQRRWQRFQSIDSVSVFVRPYDGRFFPLLDISMSGLAFLHDLSSEELKKEIFELGLVVDNKISIDRISYHALLDEDFFMNNKISGKKKRSVRYRFLTVDQIVKLREFIRNFQK